MKTRLLLAGCCFAAFAACQTSPKPTNGTDSTAVEEPAVTVTGCYAKSVGRDTFLLRLITSGNTAEGELSYNFFEKDRSKGTIKGNLKDSIIRALYSFQSEGTESKTPVVFKLSGGQVLEAIADSMNPQGEPVFPENNEQLKFDSIPYRKSDCK